MSNKIDFIVINYHTVPYIELTVKSIHKYVNNPFNIFVINNGENLSEDNDFTKLTEIYKDDDKVNILKGVEQVSDPNGEWYNCKIDGRRVSIASKNKCIAQNIGIEAGDGDYICLLDSDAIFLNEWTDKILPMLEDNIFVSHKWEGQIAIAREQFMIYKREVMLKHNLQPNIDYKDCSGYLTYFAVQNDYKFKILENSFNNPSLKRKHVLSLPGGEQAFVDNIHFLYHYARGSTRDKNYVTLWLDQVSNYLGEK